VQNPASILAGAGQAVVFFFGAVTPDAINFAFTHAATSLTHAVRFRFSMVDVEPECQPWGAKHALGKKKRRRVGPAPRRH
jgi:hypothetical protein